jgi:hypothetical protein
LRALVGENAQEFTSGGRFDRNAIGKATHRDESNIGRRRY